MATKANDEILKLQGKVANLQWNNKDLIYIILKRRWSSWTKWGGESHSPRQGKR